MTTETINSPTFPNFSRLPPELRNQIWHDSLPDKDGSAIGPYITGCWRPRCLKESDEGYDAQSDNVKLNFCHELLDRIRVKVPLSSVNCEARSIALLWVREQRIQMYYCEERQCIIFERPFDPILDVLYVACKKFHQYWIEPYTGRSQENLLSETHTICPDITHLAIPEELIRNEPSLSLMFTYFTRVSVLLVLVDAPSDLENGGRVKVRRRWEVEGNARGKAFFWNHNHGGFELRGDEYIGGQALYEQIEGEACKRLRGFLAHSTTLREFEIRPVFAVGI